MKVILILLLRFSIEVWWNNFFYKPSILYTDFKGRLNLLSTDTWDEVFVSTMNCHLKEYSQLNHHSFKQKRSSITNYRYDLLYMRSKIWISYRTYLFSPWNRIRVFGSSQSVPTTNFRFQCYSIYAFLILPYKLKSCSELRSFHKLLLDTKKEALDDLVSTTQQTLHWYHVEKSRASKLEPIFFIMITTSNVKLTSITVVVPLSIYIEEKLGQ